MINSSEGNAVHTILERIQYMFKFSANKILLASSALLLCAGLAQAQTEPVSPATAAPTSVSIQYQLGSGGGPVGSGTNVTLTIPTGADLFSIDPSTVPVWLSYSSSGNTIVPASPGPAEVVNFIASSAAGVLNAGVYTAPVHVRIAGYQDLVIPVTLAVADTASSVSVQYNGTPEANNATIALTWQYGSAYPTLPLTILSSDSPTAYTVTSSITTPTGAANWIQLPVTSGIAYDYGSTLNVAFLNDVLKNSNVGDQLAGQITVGYGSGPTTIQINVTITVTEAIAAVSSVNPIYPVYTPEQSTGSLSVVITGSGFYPPNGTSYTGYATAGGGYTDPTVVKIAYGAVAATALTTVKSSDATAIHGAVTYVNPNTMILTIPWDDVNSVGILSVAQPVNITILNSIASEAAAAATLTVTTNPIIDAITDGAAVIAPAAGATPKFAPYEMVTVWGANFGPTAGTPVVATPTSGVYPTSLTTNSHALSVAVYKQDGSTLLANAPLLFASNDQINMIVPAEVIGTGITGLQFVVTYSVSSSQPYLATPAAANPGLFTVSSSGEGQGAILNSDFSVNSDGNMAKPGSTVIIYASGLGAPNSTGADAVGKSAAKFPTSCVSVANYETAASLTTLDGAILNGTDLDTNTLPPCFTTSPSVTIGGAAATVTYAGWVSGSVTGLYQINATVPTKATSGDLPVVVTVGTGTAAVSSQTGVTVAIN
jgi:uncharacterized protein (TIGR03437 family)